MKYFNKALIRERMILWTYDINIVQDCFESAKVAEFNLLAMYHYARMYITPFAVSATECKEHIYSRAVSLVVFLVIMW